MLKGMGWVPDRPDHRDLYLKAPVVKRKFDPKFSRRGELPPRYDQSTLGSCTANGVGVNCQWAAMREKGEKLQDATPSRLMIYYLERWFEGTVPYDSGAQIRDGIKAVASYGIVDEKYWPYDISKFAQHPPAAVYRKAKQELVKQYARVQQDVASLKTVLKNNGLVVFGFTCYESLDSQQVARTGIVPMPGPAEQVVGGHCVALIGWDDSLYGGKGGFEWVNSWGEDWGDHGCGYLAYEYVANPNLCDDFWHIEFV